MDFSVSDRSIEYRTALLSFMDEFVYPAEPAELTPALSDQAPSP